jgi:hypothetical protein
MRTIRAIALAAILAATISTSVSAASSPFTGSWESIDFDGSYQVMTISGVAADGSAHLVLFDSFGTICVTVGASSTTFHGVADSVVDGYVLQFAWRHVGCGDVEEFYALGGGQLVYDPATGSVLDSFGVVWTRM